MVLLQPVSFCKLGLHFLILMYVSDFTHFFQFSIVKKFAPTNSINPKMVFQFYRTNYHTLQNVFVIVEQNFNIEIISTLPEYNKLRKGPGNQQRNAEFPMWTLQQNFSKITHDFRSNQGRKPKIIRVGKPHRYRIHYSALGNLEQLT